MSTAERIYDDSSKLGKFWGLFTSIITLVLSCVGIYFGWKLWHATPKYSEESTGMIIDYVCSKIVKTISDKDTGETKTLTTYTCAYDVEHVVNDITYTGTVVIEDLLFENEYDIGDTINIYYKPEDPSKMAYVKDSTKTFGQIIFAFSILGVIGTLVWMWALFNYKAAGGITTLGLAAQAVRGK